MALDPSNSSNLEQLVLEGVNDYKLVIIVNSMAERSRSVPRSHQPASQSVGLIGQPSATDSL